MHGPQELFIENKHMECRGEYLGEAGYVSRFFPFLHLPMQSHSTLIHALLLKEVRVAFLIVAGIKVLSRRRAQVEKPEDNVL
jgi:hypothetical protein